MSIDDIPVWEKFLEEYANAYESFDYDVRVGEGEAPLPTLEPKYKEMARALTQKRIDAIGYREKEIWIFEVKPRAAISALGQIIAYAELYTRANPTTDFIIPAIVCTSIDSDIRKLMEDIKIQIFIV